MVESRLILVSESQGTGSLEDYSSNFLPLLYHPLCGLLYVYWAVLYQTWQSFLFCQQSLINAYCSVRSYSLKLTRRPVVYNHSWSVFLTACSPSVLADRQWQKGSEHWAAIAICSDSHSNSCSRLCKSLVGQDIKQISYGCPGYTIHIPPTLSGCALEFRGGIWTVYPGQPYYIYHDNASSLIFMHTCRDRREWW